MSDTEVGVRITGNATGAVSAFNVSEEAAARALASMVEHFTKLGLISTEKMAKTGAAAKAGASEVAESATVIGVATGIMREHFVKAGESAEIMRGHFERISRGIGMFNTALIGIGAILAGGELFKESIGAAVNLTTETNRLASVFGLTLEKASGLHEALHTLGIESDAAATMAMKLSRQVKAHEDAINADGVATRNAAGEHLNLYDIMQNGINRLREMKPGYDRNAVAIDLFGRGAGDLTKLLRLNDDAMRDGMETAKALGIVVTKDGVESTVAYQHSVAEAKSVIEALWVAVGQALIPVIKELSDMLKNHGATAVSAMRNAIEGLINAVREVVAVFATFDLAISIIAGAIAALFSAVNGLGRILADVFTLNWSKIGGDFKAGIGNLVKIAHDAAAQISGDWAAMNMGWIGDAKGGKAGASSGNEANPDTGDTAPDKVKKEKKEKEPKADKADEFDELAARKEANHALDELDKRLAVDQLKQSKEREAGAMEESKGKTAAGLDYINTEEELAKQRVAQGLETQKQLLVEERAFENARYGILMQGIKERIQIAQMDPNASVEAKKRLNNELEAEQRRHELTLTKIDGAATLERTKNARAAADAVATSWGTALARMATLQAGFATTLNSMWGSIVGMIEQAVARMVTTWINSLVAKWAASKTFHGQQSLLDAKDAYTGAYKAVVGIPYVGPALAPIAGAAAFAGVMAFSAKGGYDVPGNVGRGIDGMGGQVGIVHPREMILPAETADKFRNGGGGDTHNWTVVLNDTAGAEQFFLKNQHSLAKALKAAYRDGVR